LLRDADDEDVFHDARATSIPLLMIIKMMMMMMGRRRRRRSQKMMTMILLLCLAVFLLLLQEEDLVVFVVAVVAKAPEGSSESSFAASCGTCQRCATVSEEEEEDKGFEESFEEVKERGADKNERFHRSSSLSSSSSSSDEGHDNAKAKELAENGNKCDVCFGCTHVLKEMVRTVTMKNKTYEPEIGASPATLVKVKRREKKTTTTKSDEEDEEWAIAKMWCVGEKMKPDGATVDQGGAGVCYRKEGNVIVDATSPQRAKAVRAMQNSVTMQKILDYCDASEISVRHWTERVKSVHPKNTRKIETDALFMSIAPGISITQLDGRLVKSDPIGARDALANVDHESVVKAAVMDALLGQCDRHGENIFIDVVNETYSKMTFIDNDQMFGRGWRACVTESVFIPGSEKFSIARFSNSHVNGDADARRVKTSVSLSVMLDYRCHARDGFLGKNSYGDKLDTCLSELANMRIEEAMNKFEFFDEKDAKFVLERAKGLKEFGFERAMLRWQRNSGLKNVGIGKNFRAFPWPATCCYPSLSQSQGENTALLSCETDTSQRLKCKGGADACMFSGGWEAVA
jgi:hypothetical protein